MRDAVPEWWQHHRLSVLTDRIKFLKMWIFRRRWHRSDHNSFLRWIWYLRLQIRLFCLHVMLHYLLVLLWTLYFSIFSIIRHTFFVIHKNSGFSRKNNQRTQIIHKIRFWQQPEALGRGVFPGEPPPTHPRKFSKNKKGNSVEFDWKRY